MTVSSPPRITPQSPLRRRHGPDALSDLQAAGEQLSPAMLPVWGSAQDRIRDDTPGVRSGRGRGGRYRHRTRVAQGRDLR